MLKHITSNNSNSNNNNNNNNSNNNSNWRVSEASKTLSGVTQWKIGDICLFIYVYGCTYVILYFDPCIFVFLRG